MKVPKSLIYETINGKTIYYRGYREVLRNNQTFSDIMGSSYLQSLLISCIFSFICTKLSKKKYTILTNEVGLHLGNKDNLSNDIAIYDKL
ncbi:MAG: Uma2 family endonuclease, partial [Bacteroidia bacterium]